MDTPAAPVSDHARRSARRVAALIARADALLITAGAGMSAECRLSTALGVGFKRMAQPSWFDEEPGMAWGWYGQRQQAYRRATPHAGYRMLRSWARAVPCGAFAVTSNVDGQFVAAGFLDWQVVERHGSLHRLQCTVPCSVHSWDAGELDLGIDAATLRATGALPRCPDCGALARPNVRMFDDLRWVDTEHREQQQRYEEWLGSLRGKRLVVIECGAGESGASVRRIGEQLLERSSVSLVRINPRATEADEPTFVLRLPAAQAIALIHDSLPDVFGGVHAAVPAPRPPRIEMPSAPIRLRLPPVTCVDLSRGLVAPFDPGDVDREVLIAYMRRYAEAQVRWVPVPDLRGQSAPGYTMTARIFRTAASVESATAGIAIVFVQDPDELAVMTYGIARREDEAPFLWRFLYETAARPLAAVDFPRVPWVARRREHSGPESAALRAYFAEFERVLTSSYLQFLAFLDATRGE